jgi:hypothetical protein
MLAMKLLAKNLPIWKRKEWPAGLFLVTTAMLPAEVLAVMLPNPALIYCIAALAAHVVTAVRASHVVDGSQSGWTGGRATLVIRIGAEKSFPIWTETWALDYFNTGKESAGWRNTKR